MIKYEQIPLIPEVVPFKKPETERYPNLIGMSRIELSNALKSIGVEQKKINMRLQQVWSWLYLKGASSVFEMSNVSKQLKEDLSKKFVIERPKILFKQTSSDGTRKYLLQLPDGKEIETVYIPEKTRGTICLSSQIGCTLTCPFCFTGTQKLVRNLSTAEIVGQILVVKDDLDEWDHSKKLCNRKLISNIVVMGMGEPLYNFSSIRNALKIAMDCEGLSISRKKITLSTSGIVPEINKIGEEIGCLLAISLHGTTNEIRNRLVPINKKWDIESLFSCLRQYPTLGNSNRITFEYVMLKNINDSDRDAKRLVKLISGIPAKINLIPFNPWPGSPFERSSEERISSFSEIIKSAGYSSPVRSPRGEDILAACGQLKSKSKRLKTELSSNSSMRKNIF